MPSSPQSVGFTDAGNQPITSLVGGNNFNVIVTLDSAAPTGGQDVTLSIPSGTAVSLPNGVPWRNTVRTVVTVPQGSTQASITCGSSAVSSNQTVAFTASANGSSVSANLTITP